MEEGDREETSQGINGHYDLCVALDCVRVKDFFLPTKDLDLYLGE